MVDQAVKFYAGLHHPADARHLPRAFISAHALAGRKGPFTANDWILDSGAFSTILRHGGYPDPAEAYASQIARWAQCGRLEAAVTQDYMCEPAMLERTGLTIADHQRLTIERYDRLVAAAPGVYIMPVLQGYQPADYQAHLVQYGGRLKPQAWVGVGSVCKRNGSYAAVRDVLEAVHEARADLRLHGFGIKTTSLAFAAVRDHLYSADSMAWSWAARYERRNRNDWREAARFAQRIERQMPQLGLFG